VIDGARMGEGEDKMTVQRAEKCMMRAQMVGEATKGTGRTMTEAGYCRSTDLAEVDSLRHSMAPQTKVET